MFSVRSRLFRVPLFTCLSRSRGINCVLYISGSKGLRGAIYCGGCRRAVNLFVFTFMSPSDSSLNGIFVFKR